MKTIQRINILFLTLICLNTYAQEKSIVNSPDRQKTEILKILNDKDNKLSFSYNDPKKGWNWIKVIEAKNLDNYNLILKAKKEQIISVRLVPGSITYDSNANYDRIIISDSLIIVSWEKKHIREIHQLISALHHIYTSEANVKELAVFQTIAANYKALSEKPTITEEQRKYIVQANSKNEKKEYQEALNLYKKAINVNPLSYPSAYNNMALLAAQIKDYQYAIFNMKKYLMLVPEAEDARAAQDKIYEWEAEIGK
ncbi:MAG: hypothetical protein ABFC90_05570 [Bacteroidales bacterium]|nr:tetratricopeptide repeat protein [Bacteroidales bacterium]